MLSTFLFFTTNTMKRLSHPLTSRQTNKKHNALFYKAILASVCIVSSASSSHADETAHEEIWQGEWQAEDTDFSLRVIPAGDSFDVEPLRPLGLNWEASDGVINGKNGTIYVQYQGVTAQVMVQLLNQSNAIVRPLACQP